MSYSPQDICNIQVRIKCCYAEASVQFIEAKALGDLDDAACWRKKLLSLESLFYAFCQYEPFIEEGIEEVVDYEFTSFEEDDKPATIGAILIKGVPVSNAISSSVGIGSLTTRLKAAINDYTSSRADLIVRASDSPKKAVTGDPKTRLNIKYASSFHSGETEVSKSVTVVNTTATKSIIQAPQSFDGEVPYCLSEDELQGLIDNFNALCGCGCGKNMFTDQLPKYIK